MTKNIRYSKESLGIQENKITEEEAQKMTKRLMYTEDNEPYKSVEIVIIDEVDRLKLLTLEILRDIYNQNNIGMVLIEKSCLGTLNFIHVSVFHMN